MPGHLPDLGCQIIAEFANIAFGQKILDCLRTQNLHSTSSINYRNVTTNKHAKVMTNLEQMSQAFVDESLQWSRSCGHVMLISLHIDGC